MSELPVISRPGALLVVADFHGTLAALRSLGRAGISVTVADWRKLVPARWSRWAARTLTCPDPSVDPRGFMGWLYETGFREPGQVLLPTTDDLAWLFAQHSAELSRNFILDSPSLETVYQVLNKWQLREACSAVGIDTPKSSLDVNDPSLGFPLLIKPQTQTLLFPHQKGRVVREREQLVAQYDDFKAQTKHAGALLETDPGAARPMLQELVESRGIYGLSGFIDETGEQFVVSAARKVLQKPQVLGIGLCFQQAPVLAPLAEKVRALCRHVGYHGLFEVEFLEQKGHHLLIDFNPRCFGQIGFDMARGADLPLIAYLSAVGDRRGLRDEVEVARRQLHQGHTQAWCDRIGLELFLKLRRLTGGLDGSTARSWTQWLAVHRRHLTDAVIDEDDWMPGVVAAAAAAWTLVAHPRATWRVVRER